MTTPIQWTSQTVAMRSRLLREDTYMPSDSQTTRPATPADIAEWADQAKPVEFAAALGKALERATVGKVWAAHEREEEALQELEDVHDALREILELDYYTRTEPKDAAEQVATYVSGLKRHVRGLKEELAKRAELYERALDLVQKSTAQSDRLSAMVDQLLKARNP